MDFIFSAVITLILVMDPFGNIPMFITTLKKVAPERRTFILVREIVIALVIMVVFLFIGGGFLKLLGIEQYSLSIAGGIILFIIAVKLVFNSLDEEEAKGNPKDEEPFVVPLAIPLIAGPASLSMLLILSADVGATPFYVFISVMIASFLNAVILMLSFPISNLLGKRGLIALERLTGMLLVLMSVNMIMNGIAVFVKTYPGGL
ncbi:MAG: NAAT family transporter [Elusimicrobiota bacterium]|jgi:multiple antibiotic resistance protein|nr:NAAT family transporter [Elusimicrobiota bacterium]